MVEASKFDKVLEGLLVVWSWVLRPLSPAGREELVDLAGDALFSNLDNYPVTGPCSALRAVVASWRLAWFYRWDS